MKIQFSWLQVEWFHNGQALRQSSRIKHVSDFGYVVMDIAYVQSQDSGEYVCRAFNKYGEDFTRATIKCTGKGGVFLDSLQPEALARYIIQITQDQDKSIFLKKARADVCYFYRIRELESAGTPGPQSPSTPVNEPPKFITQISDVTKLKEGQSAHFEARLTPVTDPNLVVSKVNIRKTDTKNTSNAKTGKIFRLNGTIMARNFPTVTGTELSMTLELSFWIFSTATKKTPVSTSAVLPTNADQILLRLL